MKVRRNSWHYRLYNFLHSAWDRGPDGTWDMLRRKTTPGQYQPTSLCKYFWFCVGSIIALFFLGIGITLFIGLMIFVYYVFYVPFEWISNKIKTRRAKKREANPEKYKNKPKSPPKEPGLVRSFVKAKKSRVCPLIEIVD